MLIRDSLMIVLYLFLFCLEGGGVKGSHNGSVSDCGPRPHSYGRGMGNIAFYASALREMRHAHRGLIPAAPTAAMVAIGWVLSQAADLSPVLDSALWWFLVIPVTNVGFFFVTIAILRHPSSSAGLLRYSVLLYLAGIPLILLDVLLWSDFPTSNTSFPVMIAVVAFLILYLVLYLVAIALLQAWPLANALSPNRISLFQIWTATKGYRTALISSAVIVLIPFAVVEAYFFSHSHLMERPLLILAGLLTDMIFILAASAINVTAWRYAADRISTLQPD